jgi:RES domain-containing protein
VKIRTWRLVKKKYAQSAFSGEGAAIAGGRWNSIGIKVVYTSESLSLAVLEILVGGAPIALLDSYVKIPVEFEESIVSSLGHLPKDWKTYPPSIQTQEIGNIWTRDNKSHVLKVPSVVVSEESNYLINPFHPAFKNSLNIGKIEPFQFDGRLTA